MKQDQTIDLVHLTGESLAWLRVARQGRRLELADSGRLDGPAEETLPRWSAAHPAPDPQAQRVRIYDSRPRYFCFSMSLPAAARKGIDGAVALKVRQELGVGQEQMAWATRILKPAARPDQLELFTVVARKADVEPIRLWAERSGLPSVWLGADIDAIRCLMRGEWLGAPADGPLVVLNADPAGVTLYHADEQGSLAKGRIVPGAAVNGALPPGIDSARGGMGRASFGAADWEWLGKAAPSLERLPERLGKDFESRLGRGQIQLVNHRHDWLAADAVLLGALQDLSERSYPAAWLRVAPAGSRAPMESLIGKGEGLGDDPLIELERRLPGTRRLVFIALFSMVLLATAILSLYAVRSKAKAQLAEKDAALRAPTEIERAQSLVLQTIGGERKPVLPVIEAIHRAAPQGLTLKSLAVGGDGTLQLDCVARDRNQPDAFFRALSAEPLLTDVKMPTVSGGNGGQTTFQLTAKIRDRQKPARTGGAFK